MVRQIIGKATKIVDKETKIVDKETTIIGLATCIIGLARSINTLARHNFVMLCILLLTLFFYSINVYCLYVFYIWVTIGEIIPIWCLFLSWQ